MRERRPDPPPAIGFGRVTPHAADVGTPQGSERAAVAQFLARQFAELSKRHPPESVIYLRVLADQYQHAAVLAKEGLIAEARSEMQSLETLDEPADEELIAVRRVSALPVWALICWKEGDPKAALRLMDESLSAALTLVSVYGHQYLTSKRIHLAANIARVLESTDADDLAATHVAALRAVIEGDSNAWPFDGSESLAVPLDSHDRVAIEHQLDRIAFRIATKEGPKDPAGQARIGVGNRQPSSR